MCGDDKSAPCALRSPLCTCNAAVSCFSGRSPRPCVLMGHADWFGHITTGRKRFRRELFEMKSPCCKGGLPPRVSAVCQVFDSSKVKLCFLSSQSEGSPRGSSGKVLRFFLIVSQTKWVIAPTWSRKVCLLICTVKKKYFHWLETGRENICRGNVRVWN